MSPRRRIQPGEDALLTERLPEDVSWPKLPRRRLTLPRQWWKPSRRWALPLAVATAAVVAASSIAMSSFVLAKQRAHHQVAMKEVDLLGFVRSFMTGFTTLDPFHANAYVEQIQAHATGDFAKQYRDKQNEILIQVAQAEPTKGTTLAAGVERWNDDGSANVMVATDVTFKTPDGKQTLDNTNRWAVTAQREGNQWKISSLQQVI